MEIYLFKFSACLAVFWLLYVLFLERLTMHQFKRFYLIGAVVLAMVIPLLTITQYIEPLITDFEESSLLMPMETSSVKIIQEQAPFWDLETVLWLIYGIGVLLFTVRFVANLIRMYSRISKNKNIVKRSFIYVLLRECRIPHSFFKYIFFNKATYEAGAIPKEVIHHEETHAKQLHSLDIVGLELLQIVFWFHPLIYILKHHVKLNHEFLADQAVLKLGTDTKTYQHILLQFSSNTQDYELSSAINYSSIKKRFTIMKTQTSKTRIWLSSLFVLPIIAILFYSFASREYIEKENISEIAQQSEENPESNLFLVTVEKNGDLIELKCDNGCKWSHLILEPSSEPYIINDYGFSEGNTVESDKFTFSIKPNKSGVEINGLKGTAWSYLNVPLKGNLMQAINQLGLSNLPTKKLKEAETYSGKKLEIIAIKDKLTINKKPSSPKTYVKDLNAVTKNWTDKDYKSTTPELEIAECSKDFLDQLDTNFRKTDYFLIAIQGSKQLNNSARTPEVNQEKPILEIIINRKGELLVDDELGSMERIASRLKTLAKSFDNSNAVLVKYEGYEPSDNAVKEVRALIAKYGFKTILVDASSNTPLLPPPPPPKNTGLIEISESPEIMEIVEVLEEQQTNLKEQQTIIEAVVEQKEERLKTGTHDVNGQTLYYTSKKGKTTYYNRWGQKADSKGNIINPEQTHAEDVIEGQVISKVYKDNKIVAEFNSENVSIPPPPPPAPPKVPSIRALSKRGAVFYYNDMVISSEKAIKLTDTNKNLNFLIKDIDSEKPIVKISKRPISVDNN